jgi:hypothetical protein
VAATTTLTGRFRGMDSLHFIFMTGTSTLMTFLQMQVSTYHTTWCHNPEESLNVSNNFITLGEEQTSNQTPNSKFC